jgi:hypothetical protein
MNYLAYIASAVGIVLFGLAVGYVWVLRHWAKAKAEAILLAGEA